MNTNRTTARWAGLFYLLMILTLVYANVALSRIIVPGHPVATAGNIAAAQELFRSGIVAEVFSAAFFAVAAWALYVLLRPVNPAGALLFLALNFAGGAMLSLVALDLVAALLLATGDASTRALPPEQIPGLVAFFLKLHSNGFMLTEIFYGSWLLPLGWLVFRSGILPKFLGVLLLLDGVGVLIWFLQYFLLPDHPAISYPCQVESFVAEVMLTAWLLIAGARDTSASPVPASSGPRG